MFRRLVLALVFAVTLVPVLAQVATPAASAGTACANLAALTIPNVTIKSATAVAAGPFTPPVVAMAADGQVRGAVSMTLPAFCRVEATARPTSDSDIKFEVWIPLPRRGTASSKASAMAAIPAPSATPRWRSACGAATPSRAPTRGTAATT